MSKILFGNDEFTISSFENEPELEKVVVDNSLKIFGNSTYYFDIKKGLKHKKGDLLTIPDGYLLRFSKQPSFAIIENELSSHDEVTHIGTQFVKFNSALTEISKYKLKKDLLKYLHDNSKEEKKVKKLLSETSFKNISDLLDFVIMESPIDFIVVIDEKTEELERVLSPFNTEIIVLQKFVNQQKQKLFYLDSENLIDEISPLIRKSKTNSMRKNPEIDTIVCPAREEGFNEVFLQENRWHAVRIKSHRIPKIKYLAMYEKKPISAIRYVGKVKEIKPYKNTGKYEIILDGPATKIKPVKLSNPNIAPQAPKYSIKNLIDSASTLDDIF